MRVNTGRGRGLRRFLVSLSALAAGAADAAIPVAAPPASAPEATAPVARPALWAVGDDDTVIFLFGTIHTHDGRARWFDEAVKRAFDASDTLVLETIVPSTLPPPSSSTASGGLASARATVGAAHSVGMRVDLGADQVLARAAAAAGKPSIGLEDFAAQLAMYRALPGRAAAAPKGMAAPAPAAAAGKPSAQAAPDVAPLLRALQEQWNDGDPSLVTAVVSEVRRQSPDAYRRLFVERNAAWAAWIARRLERPGVVFVAVGNGHLVGEDSVQVRLAEAGIRSARVN